VCVWRGSPQSVVIRAVQRNARYGEHEAVLEIKSGLQLSGRLPLRALRLVLEWRALHVEELLEDWDRARQRLPLRAIAPLE